MKQFLIRLVRIYSGLGAVFGGLGILSYVWGLATQAECGDFVLIVMVMGIFGLLGGRQNLPLATVIGPLVVRGT